MIISEQWDVFSSFADFLWQYAHLVIKLPKSGKSKLYSFIFPTPKN